MMSSNLIKLDDELVIEIVENRNLNTNPRNHKSMDLTFILQRN